MTDSAAATSRQKFEAYVVTRRWRLAPGRFRQTRTIVRAPSADLAAARTTVCGAGPGNPILQVELLG